MIVASYTSVKPEVANTRTYEDFYKFLGAKPEYMGVMARMNQDNTATFLTEGLMNVFYNEKKVSRFQPIESLLVEWGIDVSWVKRVPFASVPDNDGAGGAEIKVAFPERYYERYDTIIVEESHQQLIVLDVPQRKSDNYWEYVCQLIDADYSSVLDLNACQIGMQTRFLSNIQPELHTDGYTKYISNFEKHRTYIGEHRVDGTMSARYEALEDKFIKICKDSNGITKEKIFKLNALQDDVYRNFKEAKNNALLWHKTTMDANGKCSVKTLDGRDLIMGDGLIVQYERYASKHAYSLFGVQTLDLVMNQMSEVSQNPTGNDWLFVVNDRLWQQVQSALRTYLKDWSSVPTALYSQAAGKYLNIDRGTSVGATFVTYEVNGNKVSFIVDRALTRHYPRKGYGICLDLTPDMKNMGPAVAAFTLKGKEFVTNTLTGVGIKNGEVASTVAGMKYIVSGYSGIAAFAPYRSFIVQEN